MTESRRLGGLRRRAAHCGDPVRSRTPVNNLDDDIPF
jgi:preprotein translocase subunit SecA